jgi:16S rRNA (uracil1498-N3)-methyltransferase
MIRLLHEVPALDAGSLQVEGPAFHYLTRVLRLRVDDVLEVFDGHGHAWDARVLTVEPELHRAGLSLGPARTLPPLPPVTLLQGLPKGDKLELVLQKSTELGATRIWPVQCKRSVVQLSGEKGQKRAERWRRIVEEAARQCERTDVPEVSEPIPVLEAASALPLGTLLLVLDEEERETRLGQLLEARPDAPVALVIGPEGGLAREEVAALVSLGGVPVTLGSRILRTETAGLAALAVLQHLRGQLG